MKIKINCSVENLLHQGLSGSEANRLSGAIVDAFKQPSGYFEVPGAGPYSSEHWLFSGAEVGEVPQLDLTRPVQTRDGKPVEIKFIDDRLTQPVVGIIIGKSSPDAWDKSGRWLDYDCNDGSDGLDLVNVPEKVESRVGWVNVYDNIVADCMHSSRALADIAAGSNRTACIRVEYTFTKGQGL